MSQQNSDDRVSVIRQSCADVLRADSFGLDPWRFGSVDLIALCEHRLSAIAKLAERKEVR